ncbi:M48 family metallopeptidase [Paenarthrobacter nicotinovorans]|uniref:M48 family metallopeptidase n=1 Tax=Paenarthrobacter nicotinovorans TaxID=29320 RepID=UPI00166C935C|nr:SprT family zinc-dependent metalloprotease [Paenarthrobacter nicotinovorans]MBP2395382.1 putative metal-dependent hydrolase [Paenarthrobacter nicotinovorans]UKE98484.1 M48 family metallopeptidase [Paenarthrobacter nicotinovorans]UKF03272.1 M48 family metallopeptidase [Paenarthrobacter nicotinovorans]GGV24506.1 metal-dependent hydrolase [Paenarthrobacter nicotinovorans]
MSTASAYLTVSGIDVDVIYKNIKNLHIAVYPPLGRVRVAAPERLDDDAIRLAVVQRLPWIKKQREQLRNAVRQTEREMVTGESHYVWGQRYRLKVVNEPGRIQFAITGKRLTVYAPDDSTPDSLRAALDEWYRTALKREIPELIAKWQPVIGRDVAKWTVRRMKTKWGSCNRESAHVWFNIELAKKHPHCLEYIAVHEMMHLIERHHNERFTELMDQHLPDWRARRDELNAAPLVQEKWGITDVAGS